MASGSGSATPTTETSEPLLSLFGIMLPIVETDEPLLGLATLHDDDYPMNGSCYSGEHYDDGRHRSRSRSRRRSRIYEGRFSLCNKLWATLVPLARCAAQL